jgi:YVTN family beta-propeller protein
MKKNLLLIVFSTFLFVACKKDKEPVVVNPPVTVADMVAIVANEGPFISGSGSVSIVNLSHKTVSNQLFEEANGFPLGNIVQSVFVENDKAFIVVNNASKVEVAGYPGFESIATITGLDSPRYCIVAGNKAFITDWDINGVAVVDLSSYQIIDQILTGNGPEKMLLDGNNLFVANAGGTANDNRVSVIDIQTGEVIEQIETASNPNSIVIDANGDLRILCSGINDWAEPENSTPGAIYTINRNDFSVLNILNFNESSEHPSSLAINGSLSKLFYLLNGSVYEMAVSDTEISSSPLISGNFYGMGFHSTASTIVVCDAVDYQQNGNVQTYSETGDLLDTYSVGVIPGSLFMR